MITQTHLLAALLAANSAYAQTLSQTNDPAAIELLAVRAILESYKPNSVLVDSIFAVPGHAPPSMTASARPSPRQRALVDSVRTSVGRAGRDTLRVRASDPMIRGSTATISVTVDGVLPPGHPRGGFYETVAFTLERRGTTWVIRDRVQLGIS
jgi:hypothetical protein